MIQSIKAPKEMIYLRTFNKNNFQICFRKPVQNQQEQKVETLYQICDFPGNNGVVQILAFIWTITPMHLKLAFTT